MNRLQCFQLLLFLLLETSIPIQAQQLEPFKVMFYNVENLFDPVHEEGKNDEEFTPEAIRHWTPKRLHIKCEQLSRVIAAAGKWHPPALIGMCEVENANVLEQLTLRSSLRHLGYRFLITESPDQRGIDVALLYRPDLFKVLTHQAITVPLPKRTTRDILHVVGKTHRFDTIDIFVCHLPSRISRLSHNYRTIALQQLGSAIDSVKLHRKESRIFIMGDFNTSPNDPLITEQLNTLFLNETIISNNLYSVIPRSLQKEVKGTYRFQGRWETIDHLYLSGNIISLPTTQALIFALPEMLIKDKKYGGVKPYRTWNGMKFQPQGFSDHLPIIIEL